LQNAVEGQITDSLPASFLQEHHNCLFYLDEASSQELTRFKAPWLAGHIDWTEKTIRKAVCGMAIALGKPLLNADQGRLFERRTGRSFRTTWPCIQK